VLSARGSIAHRRAFEPVRRLPPWAWLLAVLTLVGALLRFYKLGSQSYWADEALTVSSAHLGLRGLIDALPVKESTPPLYFVAAWAWAKIFGTGEAGLRSLSAVAGTATIPVTYLAARTLVSERAGVVAAALTATSPLLLWYSQEARSYALFVFFTALAFLFFARALRRPSVADLVAWAACCDLALATHYFTVFVVIPEAILLLVRRPELRHGVVLAVAQIAAFGAALAPLAIMQTTRGTGSWISDVPFGERVAQLPGQFVVGYADPSGWLVVALVALALAGGALALARANSHDLHWAGMAAGIAAAIVVVPLVASALGQDFFITRNVIPAWLPLTISVAAVLAAVRGRAGPILAGVLSVLLAVTFLSSEGRTTVERPGWRAVAAALEPPAGRRLVILPDGSFDGIALPLALYLPQTQRMPGAATTVDEVAVVSKADPSHYARDAAPDFRAELLACWWGGTCSLRSAPPPSDPPAPGFRLVDRRRAGALTVLRFRAERPIRLRRSRVIAFARANRLSEIPLEQERSDAGTTSGRPSVSLRRAM
jgi:hypothetical protein